MTQDISDGAVVRYRFEATAEFGQDAWCDAVCDTDGKWVEHSDYAALSARLKEAEAERDSLIDAFKDNPSGQNLWRFWADKAGSLAKKLTEANERLAIAREALSGCIADLETYARDQFEGVWFESDFESLLSPYKKALALIDQPAEKEQTDE